MAVPNEVLAKLQCYNCKAYLSCVPIYLKDDATSLCGRCTAPDDGVTRNTPYEAFAQLVQFPCKYQEYGCVNLVTFTDCKDHEEKCEHKIYVCPLVPSDTCNWIGKRSDLLEHSQQVHAELVAPNPFVLKHDITQPSLQTFVMSAFKGIFILHIKLCTDVKTIYHSVRCFGHASLASSFLFQLDISNKECKFTKRRDMAPQDYLGLQEPTSMTTSINSLSEMFGEYEGTTFTLTMCAKCVECGRAVEGERSSDKGWICMSCTSDVRPCRFQSEGCTYKDINNKTRKHEEYFCQYATYCLICSKNIATSFDEHYTEDHMNITHNSDIAWYAVFEKWYIVNTEFGKILIFFHSESANVLSVKIRSALHSDELHKYMCEMERNGSREILGMQANGMDDWCGNNYLIPYYWRKTYFNSKITFTKKIINIS